MPMNMMTRGVESSLIDEVLWLGPTAEVLDWVQSDDRM